MKTPFLRQIVDAYVDHESDMLLDYCFVTPNKRSGVFLTKHFADRFAADDQTAIIPAVQTISDFIGDFTEDVEASRIEQLFILYNCYADILTSHMTAEEKAVGMNLVDFNRFQRWGDILLNDFNDVDRFMVDSRQLFKNVENLKEISSNYLTPEQIEVIRRYWNDDLVPQPVKEFWNHTVHTAEGSDHNGKHNVAGFIKLWQVMQEIYDEFRLRLSRLGLTYAGKSYSDVAEKIATMEENDFRYRRYIFVGFNVLSASERSVFESLQRLGMADFYWDYASPLFSIPGNKASRFMKRNIKDFPSLYNEVGGDVANHYPEVTVIAVPSTFGQAKTISPLLQQLYPDLFSTPADPQRIAQVADHLVETAIVLPDENMVQPVLTSMPEQIPVVNVTMGMSLRHTSVASLLSNVIGLQLRARAAKSRGTFFYDDVIAVLSHPIIRRFFLSECNGIVADINADRLFNIPAEFFESERYACLAPVFSYVSNSVDPESVTNYLYKLLHWLLDLLDGEAALDREYIKSYLDALSTLRLYTQKYLRNVFLEDKTVFHLIERIVGNISVSYEGVPLHGLQIMGVLETRCLDFKNLLFTSMNERIFPRRHYAKSFIPNALRRGYGMSTVEHQESMYAYYFYRLISRADKVLLLYDGRTTGLRSGGPSRFINQIKYSFPASKVKFIDASYPLKAPFDREVRIDKTPKVMERLERYRAEDGHKRLSASSINEYINCPLQFYLSHIEAYYVEDEVKDFMDEGTYGTIIHDVVEKMYMDARGDAPEIELTPTLLERLSDKRLIAVYLERAIKKFYLRIPEDDPEPLAGECAVYLKIMTRSVCRMFEREGEFADRTFFVKGEEPREVRLRVSDDMSINFYYRIDRVDRIERADGSSAIRLIDYKTGDDKLSATTVESIFDAGQGTHPKALLQLMLYCNAYSQREGYDGAVQPFIYKLRTVSINPLTPLKIGGNEVDDFRQLNDEFLEHLDGLLKEMFDKNVPFRATPSEHACRFCKFHEVCLAVE